MELVLKILSCRFFRPLVGIESIKRVVDVLLSFILLVLFSPFLLLSLLIIYFETGKNPIFTQFRTLNSLSPAFRIYKFRTLRDFRNNPMIEEDVLSKSHLSQHVTPYGSWLRKSGLDEVPQLINVLKGDMSLVGPRPFSLEDIELLRTKHGTVLLGRDRLNSKPGMTGYWQVFGDRDRGYDDLIEHDTYYELNKSIVLDVFILLITFPIVLFAQHKDAILLKKEF